MIDAIGKRGRLALGQLASNRSIPHSPRLVAVVGVAIQPVLATSSGLVQEVSKEDPLVSEYLGFGAKRAGLVVGRGDFVVADGNP